MRETKETRREKEESRALEGAVQKRQVVIINRPFVSPQQRCDRCTEPSGMITPDEAAALCGSQHAHRLSLARNRREFTFSKTVGKDSSSACRFTGGDKYFAERPPIRAEVGPCGCPLGLPEKAKEFLPDVMEVAGFSGVNK